MLLFLALACYIFVHWLKSTASLRYSSVFDITYYYLQFTLKQISDFKLKLLTLVWSLSVSFLLIEFLKDQLFIRLASQKLLWPETLQQLYKSRNEFDFISSNIFFMKESELPELVDLAKKTKHFEDDDFTGKLTALASGKTAYLGNSNEVEAVAEVLRNDQFAILDERYILSHVVFYVSKQWTYQRGFIKL